MGCIPEGTIRGTRSVPDADATDGEGSSSDGIDLEVDDPSTAPDIHLELCV